MKQMQPHMLSTNFKLEDFSECFRGPLKTVRRATCSQRACSCTKL